jgi:uncharacterized protein YrzB (UPF0473 family)
MKRFLALALSILMILGVLLMAGCGKDGSDSTTTKKPAGQQTTGGNQDNDSTSSSDDQGDTIANDPYQKMNGYEDISFGGREFVIHGADGESDGFNSAKEIYSEEADAISVAVRQRNSLIESFYDCKIKGVASPNPAGDASTDITGNQHTLDLYTHHYSITGVAGGGNAYNLLDIGSRSIDFSQPWFDQQYVNSYTIKNSAGKETLYSIVGNFALTTYDCTHAIVYNKTVYQNDDDINSIDIYDLVRNKKWTMDQFQFMIKNVAVDAAGGPEIDSQGGDVSGWIRTTHASHGLHAASGLSILKTTNGVITFDVDKNTETWTNVINKAIEIWAMPEGQTVAYSVIPQTLASGNALFASEILGSSLGNLKDLDAEIGLLPYPLFSETQENYAHYVDNHVYSYSIPVSVPDPDTVADFLAVYAFHSQIVREAYINVYAYDYCSDPQSAEMLGIILDTMTYDPGYLSANLEGEISNFIQSGGNKVAQFAAKRAASANEWIGKLVADIDDNNV